MSGIQVVGAMSEKQKRFVAEYMIDGNGKQAAIRAGYSPSRAANTACELLQDRRIKAQITKASKRVAEEWSDKLYAVVEQVYYCVTREGSDFIDSKTGKVITDLRLLPRRAAAAIDGIEQEVTSWVDADGVPHEKIKTKLKLVPKAGAIDLAMRHKGMFAPTKTEETRRLVLDVDQLYQKPTDIDEVDQTVLDAEHGRFIEE